MMLSLIKSNLYQRETVDFGLVLTFNFTVVYFGVWPRARAHRRHHPSAGMTDASGVHYRLSCSFISISISVNKSTNTARPPTNYNRNANATLAWHRRR